MGVLHRALLAVLLLTIGLPTGADAQPGGWAADVTAGWTGFVDETTDHFFTAGGAVRRYVTPRISIGPEFVVMTGEAGARDLAMMLTGNVVFDVSPARGPDGQGVVPFLAGGLGLFLSKEQFATGPFWATDPAFTAGGGVRVRIAERIRAVAEYRLGWELHQRITASVMIDLR